MSDEIHIHNQLPDLFAPCSYCDGKKFTAYIEDGVPTAVWCEYCDRTGWELSAAGYAIVQVLDWLELRKASRERRKGSNE